MDHDHVEVNGARLHVTRTGRGRPLLLLHGWPEIALTWEPVMRRLAGAYELVAPDLRGFGDSDKPSGPFGAADQAADLGALLDTLGFDRVGIVGHDVGGAVMQAIARAAPARVAGLFFFDFVYPGIGVRMGAPDRLGEIWYQSFHQLPLALELAGASRASCRAYIDHFLRHWAHRPDAFDDVLERFVDAYAAPGNLAGGFAYYQAAQPGRIAMLKGEAPPLPPIVVPTCVRWAEHDPLFPYAWTDRLGETFTDLDLARFPGVGHFPHREDPDRAAREIDGFFTRIGWRSAAGCAAD
jgi:pimeloyl-ACP methyl ester carboxylesterase